MLKFLICLAVAVGVLLVLNHMATGSYETMEDSSSVHSQKNDEHKKEDSKKDSKKETRENMVAGPNERARASCFPKDQVMPQELLPHDNSSLWAQVNPQGVGSLKDKNFLQAGHHIGVNTVGQTLRNANLQLRSEPSNPQVHVSPWQQSTIEPDMNRKPLEIGQGPM